MHHIMQHCHLYYQKLPLKLCQKAVDTEIHHKKETVNLILSE